MYVHTVIEIDGKRYEVTFDGDLLVLENLTDAWEVRAQAKAPEIPTVLAKWQRCNVPISAAVADAVSEGIQDAVSEGIQDAVSEGIQARVRAHS